MKIARIGLLLTVGCGEATTTFELDGGLASDASMPSEDAGPEVTLGLNDVTILLPLPGPNHDGAILASDTMGDGRPLVPRLLFDRLVNEPFDESFGQPVISLESYDRLQLVALRIDLCDRNRPGPCTEGEDGRLRLVLQPFAAGARTPGFEDAGFHAFYAVPAGDFAALVAELRALARLGAQDPSAPLGISTGSPANDPAYREAFRNLLHRWAGESKLVRLTMNAQPVFLAQVRWVMRGLEKEGDQFVSARIPGLAETTEHVLTGNEFELRPVSTALPGLAEAISQRAFEAASEARRRELLSVLATAENPDLSAPDNVSCAACHVTTSVFSARLRSAGIDESQVEGLYTSEYDLTVSGRLSERVLTRALGWFGTDLLISRRVVNDTAQVLLELERRFPSR